MKGIYLLIITLFLLSGCKSGEPETAATGPKCPPDVPPCICNPFDHGCEDETDEDVIPNYFKDRVSNKGIYLNIIPEQESEQSESEKLREQLAFLHKRIQQKANRKVSVFVFCEKEACESIQRLQLYTENYLGNSRGITLQNDRQLADLIIRIRKSGDQIWFEATDMEGSIGDKGVVVAQSSEVFLEEVEEVKWIEVQVPVSQEMDEDDDLLMDEDDDLLIDEEDMEEFKENDTESLQSIQRYNVQQFLVSRGAFGDSDRSNYPKTAINFLRASEHCEEKYGKSATLVNVHVFEYALRAGSISGYRSAMSEMVRLSNRDDALEGNLINEKNDLFDFSKHQSEMLIFNWVSGKYDSAKKSYYQENMGFRCMIYLGKK